MSQQHILNIRCAHGHETSCPKCIQMADIATHKIEDIEYHGALRWWTVAYRAFEVIAAQKREINEMRQRYECSN